MYDVVVIGAGPAGALAARQVARRGASVLLVDKARFPRDKICGGCLNRDALATLERVGLESLVDDNGIHATAPRLRCLHLAVAGRSARIALPGGAAIARRTFDMALVEAADRAGATFRDGTTAWLGRGRDGTHRVALDRDGELDVATAKVAIVADGLGGRSLRNVQGLVCHTAPASRVGVGAIVHAQAVDGTGVCEPGTIYMACGRGGYAGLVRLADGTVDVAAALDPAQVREHRGPAGAVAALVHEAGLPVEQLQPVHAWQGTAALTQRRRPVAGERWFVIGDAAGYVEPFTGEGIAWALAGAEQVADLAVEAVHGWRPALGRAWARRYWRHIAWRQQRCRLVAAALRRPGLVRSFVTLAGWRPMVAAPLAHWLTAAPRRAAAGGGR